jgi:hypothetical protein
MTKLLRQITYLELNNIKGVCITKDGICEYLHNMPTVKTQLIDPLQYTSAPNKNIYIIPKDGDILLNICISGYVNSAKLFQYDNLGSKKIIYDFIEKSQFYIMSPFGLSGGIPLLQLNTDIYLEINSNENEQLPNIIATYAVLDRASCMLIKSYQDESGHYIKIRHNNGKIYQFLNIRGHGNILAEINY